MLAPSPAQAAAGGTDVIVLLREGKNADDVASRHKKTHGAQVSLIYRHALKGYAARLSAGTLATLAADPDVLSVYADSKVHRTDQLVSNAVRRLDADQSSGQSGDGMGTVDVNIAVIDDGIDGTHPELNVVGGSDCLRGNRIRGRPNKGLQPYHGTMVGGFIAARDNDIGVVGVAPGARLWAVRALDDEGFGYASEVVCGLDWVTSTRNDSDPTNDISVANMSLAGPLGCPAGKNGRCPPGRAMEGACVDTKNPMYRAVCRAVAAGVTIVAAAGNEGQDLGTQEPATFSEVIAVTAMGDRDGQPGGLGGQFMCDPLSFDDVAAYWSNFAAHAGDFAHTVSAPGVCDVSTYPGGLYAVGSGTSFATPMVSGTVALCIASGACAGLSPTQIVSKIVGDAASYNGANPAYGFQGDPIRPIPGKYYGYLVRAAQY
jgi:subtilisin family serine protease